MAYQPIEAPHTEPRRGLRTALVIAGVLLVLCALGGVVGGVWLLRAGKAALGSITESTATYLDAVRARDFPAAYRQLCASTRARMSQEEFARLQGAQPELRDYEIIGASITNTNGRTSAATTVRLAFTDGKAITQVFTLTKENGTWYVCE